MVYPTIAGDRAVRATTRNKYVERFSRTERMRNNPVVAMTRALNRHYAEGC